MSFTRKPRAGRANGKQRVKARTLKRTLDAWELYQKDWSQKRIAESLGITQSAVSQILTRTYREMSTDIAEIAGMSLIKELERTRKYCEANQARAMKDPATASVMLRWLERQDKLLGLGVTKHEFSGQVHHTTNLDWEEYSADDLACLEYLIAKGSHQAFDPTKKVVLVDNEAVPLLEFDQPIPLEPFDNEIDFGGKPQ
jgi:transcriptional regulator with XRE-family HTH domain